MCCGAILNARIPKLYYAVLDEQNGGISKFDMLKSTMNHTTNASQLLDFEAENKTLIKAFFKDKRKKAR